MTDDATTSETTAALAPDEVFSPSGEELTEGQETQSAELIEQPAKVMRIGTMVKQLLDEVRAAPLDEAGRARLKEIYSKAHPRA